MNSRTFIVDAVLLLITCVGQTRSAGGRFRRGLKPLTPGPGQSILLPRPSSGAGNCIVRVTQRVRLKDGFYLMASAGGRWTSLFSLILATALSKG